MNQASGRWQAMSAGTRLAVGGAAVAVLVALAVAASSGVASKSYKVLFSNVNGADGAAMVAALQQMNVPYQFTEGGGAVMVPEDLVYETRLKLAGQGLPKSGNVGFELLENQKFGTSQFVERVNYLRGLEGELSRSIASIGQVKAARVHLAVPKQTAFVREQERASASVLITLYPGRMLDPAQSAAIARLVSSSVPGMAVQDVSILDTEGGNLMASQQRGSDMDAMQLKHTAEMEAVLSRRLAAILEPLTGKDGFRAQVTVDMSFDERERTAEVFSRNSPPDDQSIRSEQTVETGPGGAKTGGIPGSLTNQAQNPPEAPIVQDVSRPRPQRELVAPGAVETGISVSDSGGTRRERTINYEVDRSIERFKATKGQIRRVSAAVILDNKQDPGATARKPYTPEEIQQISTLVRDAIGFLPTRGDTVSVVNLPFSSMEGAAVDKSLISAELLSQLLRYAAIGAAALFVWLALVRPFIRSRTAPPALAAPAKDLQVAQLDADDAEQRDRNEAWGAQREAWLAEERRQELTAEEELALEQEKEAGRKRRYDDLVTYLQQYVNQEPDKTALQLRAWVAEPAPQIGSDRATRGMDKA